MPKFALNTGCLKDYLLIFDFHFDVVYILKLAGIFAFIGYDWPLKKQISLFLSL